MPELEQTLIIIKPDGLEKGLVGRIKEKLGEHGLVIVDNVRVKLAIEWVEKFYEAERDAVYFEELVRWVSSAEVLILMVQGPLAVPTVKWKIVGRYPNGIRGEHAENWIRNVAHAPDSDEAARRESDLARPFFEEKKCMDEKRFEGKVVFALTGMSECGKSTVGKYLDARGIPRLKIVRLFEKVRDKWSPGEELYGFTAKEEAKDPYKLWDDFIAELMAEMENRGADVASIESLYGGGLGPYLKQRMGDHFHILYVDVPLETRLHRQIQREGLTNLEEARAMLLPRDEIKEKSGIPALKEQADEVIDNSGTIDDLYRQVDATVARYAK